MTVLLIWALALGAAAAAFWGTAFGTLAVIGLILVAVLALGKLLIPPEALQDLTTEKLREIVKKALLVGANLFFLVLMIYYWPSPGSYMVLAYMIVPLPRAVARGIRSIVYAKRDEEET